MNLSSKQAPKSAGTLFAMAALLIAHCSWAELLFYDGFDYPPGQKLGNPTNTAAWDNSKSQIVIAAGSLEYTGLQASTGNRVSAAYTAPNLDSVRTANGVWPEQSGGTLYVSFVLRLQSVAGIGAAGEGASLMTVSHTSNDSQLFGINLLNDGKVRLGALKYPSDGSLVSGCAFFTEGVGANLSPDGSTTYFIVAKYEWVEGASNDVVTVWVNPGTLGKAEDPGGFIFIDTGADGLKSAGRLTLSRGPNVDIDELRIGRTWASVTPGAGPPKYLFVVGALTIGLLAASFWITHLRRKVAERSAALGAQIQERQRAEHQRLMEQDRARIARDLHDELGADITEISMLATRAQNGADGTDSRLCLEQVANKTRQMVAKLEDIVWAMNPQHDSLGAVVSYFSFFADRFLGLANIRFVVDASDDALHLTLDARARHQLFLTFREALANVVKHSGASEVRLSVRVENGALQVGVSDNGCGLRMPDSTAGGQEGIGNMRKRIEKLGGQFHIAGEAGRGTTVTFSVPLSK